MSNRFPTLIYYHHHRLDQRTAVRTVSTTHFRESTVHPEPDKAMQDIADYMHDYKIDLDLVWMGDRASVLD
jgi:hypothetical protein